MTITDYYAEFMKQSFSDSVGINYTPIAFMLFLKEKRYVVKSEPVLELCRFVYRFYADNPNYAKQNSSIVVSNISHYFVSDLREYILEQLEIWMKNGSAVFMCDGTSVFTNPEMPDIKDLEMTMLDKVIESLSLRNFNSIISYSTSMEDLSKMVDIDNLSFDEYCAIVNSTRFCKRAFEDINYCPCCEEISLAKLQAIHLDFAKDLNNPVNSIVMCKTHAWLYYNHYFRFNKSGKVVIHKTHSFLDRRMHLNLQTVTTKREFL